MKRAVVLALAAVLALAGCTSDPLAESYQNGSEQGYISGDGAQTELPPSARKAAVEFAGVDENGGAVSSSDYAGQVYVVNFWYASCPPCRAEAPDLVELNADYPDVPFLGVNVSDTEDVAIAFATKFGVEYPSIIDVNNGVGVQLAFAADGSVAPNAVPTTVVIDREGRVAARISGLIRDKSILASMIDTVVAESAQ